ncbi:MAG: helix-turn-helix domain-containing protein [Acidimicrobiales bacterium]
MEPSPLQVVRFEQGKTLRATAREACVDPGHLARIEKGQAQPRVAVRCRLAGVLEAKELELCLRPFVRATK